MFKKLIKKVWKPRFRKLTPNEKLVLLRLICYENCDGKAHWTSKKTIAFDTRLKIKDAKIAIRSLLEKTIIFCEEKNIEGGATTYLYTVNYKKFEDENTESAKEIAGQLISKECQNDGI